MSDSARKDALALQTPLCELLGCRYPVVQTAMGWVAGPELVAATSNAGGFGFLAGAKIAADQIEAAWIAVLALLKTRLLALPDRLAPQLFDQPTVGDTRNLIRAAIREVLDDLAQPDIELEADIDLEGVAGPEADGGEGTGGSEATAGPDDQRLGGSKP